MSKITESGNQNPIQPQDEGFSSKIKQKFQSKIGTNFKQDIPENLQKLANRIKESKVGDLFSNPNSPLRLRLTNTKAILKASFQEPKHTAQSLGSKIVSLKESDSKIKESDSKILEDNAENRERVKESVVNGFQYATVAEIDSQLYNLALKASKSRGLSWDDELTKDVLIEIRASRTDTASAEETESSRRASSSTQSDIPSVRPPQTEAKVEKTRERALSQSTNANPEKAGSSRRDTTFGELGSSLAISEENVLAKTQEIDEARAGTIRNSYEEASLDELAEAYAEAAGRKDKVKTGVLGDLLKTAAKESSEQELTAAYDKATESGKQLEKEILFELLLVKSTTSPNDEGLSNSLPESPQSNPSNKTPDEEEFDKALLEFESTLKSSDDSDSLLNSLSGSSNSSQVITDRRLAQIMLSVDEKIKEGKFSQAKIEILSAQLENDDQVIGQKLDKLLKKIQEASGEKVEEEPGINWSPQPTKREDTGKENVTPPIESKAYQPPNDMPEVLGLDREIQIESRFPRLEDSVNEKLKLNKINEAQEEVLNAILENDDKAIEKKLYELLKTIEQTQEDF